jgi:hypothetical protein
MIPFACLFTTLPPEAPLLATHRLPLPCLLVATALLLPAGGFAAEPRPAGFGKGKPGGPVLSRAELRECMAQMAAVRSLNDEAAALQAALGKEQAEIGRIDAARKEKRAALDVSNGEAVDAYNGEGKALEQRIDAYNARTPTFNTKVEALQLARDTFAKTCDNRNYDEKDEAAIKNGK